MFVLVPLVPLVDVRELADADRASSATIIAMGALAWFNWRVRMVPVGLFFLAHIATAVMFSRLLGPFVLTPTLICAILLSATTVPWLNDRPWAVILGTLVMVMLPFVLEWLGCVRVDLEHRGRRPRVARRRVRARGRTAARAIAILANLGALIVVAAYARRRRARSPQRAARAVRAGLALEAAAAARATRTSA